MKLLLDTQVVLWALGDPQRLRAEARAAIEGPENDLAVSAASAWEVAIKRALGKLELPGGIRDWLLPAVEGLGAVWFPISAEDAAAIEALTHHHRDPFDRLLIAQAVTRGCTLVSADAALTAYPVSLLRA